jgi:N-sulfoglucosamine sulfohydrolase
VCDYAPGTPEALQDSATLQGAIHALDGAVAQITAALEKYGLAKETLLLFTTDHGLAMPRAKCTLYDPGVETLLIWRWPARGLSDGRRLSELISHVDIVPALLDALALTGAGESARP